MPGSVDSPSSVTHPSEMDNAMVDTNVVNSTIHYQALDDTIRWMNPSDPFQALDFFAAQRTPGTSEWFLNGDEFNNWKENPNSLLWLQGDSGTGKSVMVSAIVDDLNGITGSSDNLVTFFFFDFRDVSKQTLKGMIVSLLYQILTSPQEQQIFPLLRELHETHQLLESNPSDSEWMAILKKAILSVKTSFFLIIDALDEMDKQSHSLFYQLMMELHSMDCSHLHIFLASQSQPQTAYGNALKEQCLTSAGVVSMSKENVDRDIKIFLRHTMQHELAFHDHGLKMKKIIRESLIHKANGRFLWVNCQLTELKACIGPSAVEFMLNQLPGTLHETYISALQKIEPSRSEDTKRILQWLCFIKEPLSMSALGEVMAVAKNDSLMEFKRRQRVASDLIHLLGTTFTSVAPDGYVMLAHASVKEFLLSEMLAHHLHQTVSQFHMNAFMIHSFIAECCMKYLLQVDNKMDKIDELNIDYPLLSYAAKYWFQHIHHSHEGNFSKMAYALINPDEVESLNWVVKFSDFEENEFKSWEHGGSLYYACKYGLDNVVSKLLLKPELNMNINKKGGRMGSALGAAADGGHLNIVKVLIENKSDINIKGYDERTPLIYAAEKGCAEIVALLLEKKANIKDEGKHGITALRQASKNGHLSVVQLLLNKGVDVDSSDFQQYTPLIIAAEQGHLGIVALLLQKQANFDAKTKKKDTALKQASGYGHLQVAKVLLEKKPSIDAPGFLQYTPLIIAAEQGHLEMVALLLQNGANVNAEAQYGTTALRQASLNGHMEVVQLLLQKKANVDTPGFRQYTPLIIAAENGYLDIVALLLQKRENIKRANINAQAENKVTALRQASQNGHLEVVRLLLEEKADVDTPDIRWCTPLILAAQRGHLKIVALLIQSGAEINAQADDGYTPLIRAAEQGHLEIVALLLQNKAKINAQTEEKLTALRQASQNGHLEIAQLLLKDEADVDTLDIQQCTPLIIAAERGHLEIVKLLIKSGAKVTAQAENKTTALKQASLNGHIAVAQLLLERLEKVDIDIPDIKGYTPLIIAAQEGHPDLVALLLQNEANVNAQAEHDVTALRQASQNGHLEVVQLLLLEEGTHIDPRDILQYTPLIIAAENGHLQVVKLLLRCGANVNAQAEDGITALKQASQNGHLAIAEFLRGKGAVDI